MKIKTELSIHDLEMSVYLGWSEVEREKKQIIFLSINISFPNIPIACKNDNLSDTICYSSLIKFIRNRIAERKFRLVEYLTQEIYIYILIRQKISIPAKVRVCLTKKPKIQGLINGACFNYESE